MPSSKRQKKAKRRHRKSSGSQIALKNEEELLQSTTVRKEVKQLVLTAIDDVADTLKQIPRTLSSPMAPGGASSLQASPGHYLLKDQEDGSSPSPNSSNASKLAFPETHGVFPPQPIYCRDRYFQSSGKRMYTRELFSANGAPLEPNLQKLDELRGHIIDAVTFLTPVNATDTAAAPENLKTIVVENIEKDAKGLTLKIRIKIIKPDGTPKVMDLTIDMPDFEPCYVIIGEKAAVLE